VTRSRIRSHLEWLSGPHGLRALRSSR
jgi:hypothetical protein